MTTPAASATRGTSTTSSASSTSPAAGRSRRGRHTLQTGVEYRHINFEGEYMSRTNGDLDYGNWAFFFTGHGAAGGGSDLDQGDTPARLPVAGYRRLHPGRLAHRRRADAERRPALRHRRQPDRTQRAHRQLLPARRGRRASGRRQASRCRATAPSSSRISRRCRSASTSNRAHPST